MENKAEKIRADGFSSKFGFIIACIGSAVGMANIWRFPYLVSEYGGLTFLLPYFLFVVIIASSGVMEEFSGPRPLGRRGARGLLRQGRRRPRHKPPRGRGHRRPAVVGSLGLAIGYSVVMGWIFKYTKMSISGELFALGQDMAAIGSGFDAAAPTADTLGEAVGLVTANGRLRRRQRLVDNSRRGRQRGDNVLRHS